MVIDLSCVSSPACCLLTTSRSDPIHYKMASSICGKVPAENTLVRPVPTVVDFGRPGLVLGITVLFNISPCLCSGPVLSHLVVIVLHILACTLRFSFSPRFPLSLQNHSTTTIIWSVPQDLNHVFRYALLKSVSRLVSKWHDTLQSSTPKVMPDYIVEHKRIR